jgi:lipid II:glycine glycyltransferase (peptidoglycan interpeptide bridge formation enzyme)
MARWELLTPEAAARMWDETLLSLEDYTTFQSYAWGEYRRALGWEPCHWIAYDEEQKVVAMMLGLVRRYPFGLGMVWCEGGPVGDLTACDASLQATIMNTTRLKRVYMRFRCDRSREVRDTLVLSANGWTRSWSPLTSNYSMGLCMKPSERELLAGCERNWRRNLNRANDCGVKVKPWINPDINELLSIYSAMQNLKGLSEQQSREELEFLLTNMRQQMVLYRAEDSAGQLLSITGWLFFGDRAWMWLSATSEEGRKQHASYAVLWSMVQLSLERGVQFCDLCGIDPVANHGVYRFKRGTGADPLEYLGEWDWASSDFLRWFGNLAISRRAQLRTMEGKLSGSKDTDVREFPATPPREAVTTEAQALSSAAS